ncbi:family 20 glycosylhydrolase [Alistipes sp.]|uniref:beta-N-acetylhexosaminidase n=1 Tax=Alistipes sp. TaxID=1872444 RepID=UPI0025BA127B|nr:family 20 glycosylhydrolase [Alistipes sp.]
MNKQLFPEHIHPGWKISIFLLCLTTLSSCISSEDACINIIPHPAKMEVQSGYFQPENMTVNDFTTVVVDNSRMDALGREGYELEVDCSSVRLTAATQTGIFYGKRTLEQLITNKGIPCIRISDRPRFPYRGLHMDVSRHFFPKSQILKVLNEMARYKLNVFHFHLTDNGGWRIQIDKYPRLTAEGAFRTQQDWYAWWDQNDRRYLPEGTPGAYGGYFTKDDIREIVAYAAERQITVIPEIEFPAHSDAVFIGYPELCCTGKPYTTGEFCVGNERVYTFMKDVLTEVMELFPSKYIHIGGDEARKVAWATCPKCQALIKKENLDGIEGLQPYMISRIQDYLASKGRIMVGWDEILRNDLHPETLVMSYRGQKGAIEAANKGNYAVMTPGEVLYFDWYQADPSTQPRAMYGYSPIKKMYAFDPVPDDPESAVRNESIIRAKSVNSTVVESIRPNCANNIVGVQGCMWTEYIEDEEQLEYMVFPRLLAVAELAWTPQEKRQWNDFKIRMNSHIPLLQQRNLNTFTLSDEVEITTHIHPGNKTVEVTLDCEKYPVEIRYTLDGTPPTPDSSLYEAPFTVTDSTEVRAAICREGVIQSPERKQLITLAAEIRNYYPFEVPEVWKDYFE